MKLNGKTPDIVKLSGEFFIHKRTHFTDFRDPFNFY